MTGKDEELKMFIVKGTRMKMAPVMQEGEPGPPQNKAVLREEPTDVLCQQPENDDVKVKVMIKEMRFVKLFCLFEY